MRLTLIAFGALALLGQTAEQGKGASKGQVVARVNGDSITLEEVDAVLKERPGQTPLSDAQHRQQRRDIVSGMIDDLLMRQFLRQHGPKIDSAEVDKSFAALEASQKAQGRTLAEYLKESRQTEAQVRANIVTMLQMIRYVKENTSEEVLRRYFEQNRDFFDRTTVHVSHILVRVSLAATTEERRKARAKVESLRAQIIAGRIDFAAAVKTYSECPSASKGGDVGWIVRKWQVDESFARAAFALKNVGDLSGIVESEMGLHLIRLTERKPGTPSKYETCVEDVRDCYTDELRQSLIAQLRKQARIEIKLP